LALNGGGQLAFPGGVFGWSWPGGLVVPPFPVDFTHTVFGAADAVAISDGAITSANALIIATVATVVVVVVFV
jgi:hypothetical protein